MMIIQQERNFKHNPAPNNLQFEGQIARALRN